MANTSDDNNLALYCDFENIALGVRDARYKKFNINHILERLLVKGSIVVKKAYCDWERYKDFKAPMHEGSFELIDIPHVRMSGKNSADIRMVVDALDLCYTKSHVDTFVIISGDSDFSPLVSKLRENAKTVIGVGVKNSTSDLLISNCDEFIFYDDLVREIERKQPARKRVKKRSSRAEPESKAESKADNTEAAAPQEESGAAAESSGASAGRSRRKKKSSGRSKTAGRAAKLAADDSESMTEGAGTVADASGVLAAEAAANDEYQDDETDTSPRSSKSPEQLAQEGIDLVLETASALSTERGGADKLWGSMVKQTLKRRRPGFNESYYGFDSFGSMLKEAEKRALLKLELDDRSGGFIIRDIAD